MTYYAVWESISSVVVNNGIFDAEFTYIDPNEVFPGLGGEAIGKSIISADEAATTQHKPGVANTNGYYVGYLYKKGATLRFVINSSEAVENATLKARLGSYMFDMNFTPDGESALKFKVNGNSIDYGNIELKGNLDLDFNEVVIGNIALGKGKNIIEIVVDNDSIVEGTTMQAHAPVVDYIKLENTGDAVLSWKPEYDNIYR